MSFDREAVFPLALVPFERYMWLDDRPDWPMTGILCMEFRGELHRPAFEASLEEALSRHPLYWAHVRPARGGLRWIAAERGDPPLDWAGWEEPMRCARGGAIDLRTEVGFRLWVRQGGGRARLAFLLHHCVSDAIGGMQLLGDVLACYAIRRGGGAAGKLEPPDPGRYRKRGTFEEPPPEPVSRWAAMRFTAAEGWKWLTRPVSPLRAPREFGHPAEGPHEVPGIHLHQFDAEQTQALRDRARAQGRTINDLLLRDLFLALRSWNAAGGRRKKDSKAWLRIAMPTNLREKADARLPAANKMGYAFLSRRPRDCDDEEALLAGIGEETEAIKHWRMGLAFLSGLEMAMVAPGAMRWIVSERRCAATAVLSNLGDPEWHFWSKLPRVDGLLQAGDVLLAGATGSPPLRPLTRACFVAARYAGRLSVNVRCDRRTFCPEAARELLASYVGRLERTMEAAG